MVQTTRQPVIPNTRSRTKRRRSRGWLLLADPVTWPLYRDERVITKPVELHELAELPLQDEAGCSATRRQSIELAVLAMAVVAVVPSVKHENMVLMPMSITEPHADSTDSDVNAFRDHHRFVADRRRTGHCWQCQERSNK